MRFTHIDVNFDVRYEGYQNCPKILSMNILRVFSDHHFWRQNWCQYLWTSLCQFNFFVNLLHSLGISFFDIWHLFDNLTSFWQLDIFLIFWEQITHGPHCPYPCTPLPMYPIAHVAHTPYTPIAHVTHTPVPHCPCDLLPMWPILLVPHTSVPPLPIGPIPLYPIAHTPCTPYPWTPITHVPHTPVPPLPIGPMAHEAYTPCAPYPLYTIAHVPHWPPLPPLGNGPYG